MVVGEREKIGFWTPDKAIYAHNEGGEDEVERFKLAYSRGRVTSMGELMEMGLRNGEVNYWCEKGLVEKFQDKVVFTEKAEIVNERILEVEGILKDLEDLENWNTAIGGRFGR